jgi:hypothetical protein
VGAIRYIDSQSLHYSLLEGLLVDDYQTSVYPMSALLCICECQRTTQEVGFGVHPAPNIREWVEL